MRSRLVDSWSDVADLQSGWRRLWHEDPQATIFQSFDWVTLWIRLYESYISSLYFIVCEERGRCVGLMPLYVRHRSLRRGRRRTLMFTGTGEDEVDESFAEYMAPLCVPEYREACYEVFAERIRQCSEARSFAFHRVRADLVQPLVARFSNGSRSVQAGYCFTMPTGTDNALNGLGARQRGSLRRKLRQLRAQPGFQESVASQESERAAFYADLKRLHEDRWRRSGKSGVFNNRRFDEFHDRLSSALLQQGQLLLYRIAVAKGPLVVVYGLCDDAACRFYQSGVDMELHPQLSPGLLAHLLLADRAEALGLPRYDLLLAGNKNSYKARLGEATCSLWNYSGAIQRSAAGS